MIREIANFEDLHQLNIQDACNDWRRSWETLRSYNDMLASLSSHFSMFELALNLKFRDDEGLIVGPLFAAFAGCCILEKRNEDRIYFLNRDYYHNNPFVDTSPYALTAVVFRLFFEYGRGNNPYQSVAEFVGGIIAGLPDEYGRIDPLQPNVVSVALRQAWGRVFAEGAAEFRQGRGVDFDVFKSRCWLVRKYTRGLSQLRLAVRAFREMGMPQRMNPSLYPDAGAGRCEDHLRLILTEPRCELEREFYSAFVDTAAVDRDRFDWFDRLDDDNRSSVTPLVRIVNYDNELCFAINDTYGFDSADPETDLIIVKVTLRTRVPETSPCYSFSRNRAGWTFDGVAGRRGPYRIWQVKSIVVTERSCEGGIVLRQDDILGKMLFDACASRRRGAFLLRDDATAGFYFPESRRNVRPGNYKAYVFEREDGDLFTVRRYLTGTHGLAVNEVALNGRSFTVLEGQERLDVSVDGETFFFGTSDRSPLRDPLLHESHISGGGSRIFINKKNWPIPAVGEDWRYMVDGQRVIQDSPEFCYRNGVLVYTYHGRQITDQNVTFVDFSSDVVARFFRDMPPGVATRVHVDYCGRLNGWYDVEAQVKTVSIPLPGNRRWMLNIPLPREGVVFSNEEGEIGLALQFSEQLPDSAKYLAIDDLRHLHCTVHCANGYDHAEICSITPIEGEPYETCIPLPKSSSGFVFSDCRRSRLGRGHADGDRHVNELLSIPLRVSEFVMCEVAAQDSDVMPARKYCRIKLYDPKSESLPEANRALDGQLITLRPNIAFHAKDRCPTMKWLCPNQLSEANAIRKFSDWTAWNSTQDPETGKWQCLLNATTLHQAFNCLHNGAVALSFLTDNGDRMEPERLISGGFCLRRDLDDDIHPGHAIDWESDFRLSMHERYGTNSRMLARFLSILTLRTYGNCYNQINGQRNQLRQLLSNVVANVRNLGRGADHYMNAIFNCRRDQWSGYLFFAGWYFVEQVNAMLERDDDSRPEDALCFLSSTGRRIWSPMLISRRSVVMANNHIRWSGYYLSLRNTNDLTLQQLRDNVADFSEANPWYYETLCAILRIELGIELPVEFSYVGIDDAINRILGLLSEWRTTADGNWERLVTEDEHQANQAAGDFMAKAQSLRNVLLALQDLDAKAEVESERSGFFYDLLRIRDAQQFVV